MAAAAVTRIIDIVEGNPKLSAAGKGTTDIEYHPNEDKWKARTARRLAENPTLPETPLPEGFPNTLKSPLVWEGKDWKKPSDWEYELSVDELKEIDDAVQHFKALRKPFGYITPSTFPLPKLGPILHHLSRELHNGRGFFVLRTIPVANYSKEDNILIYAGVSSYIGTLRGVQDKGDGVLAHIKDLTQTHPLKIIGAPAYTTDKQVFHTDAGDIISLFVLEIAGDGGLSRISSSWKVYNELAQTRPDLIKTLSEPWPVDGFGGKPPYTSRPLLFHHDSKIIIQYARRLFTGFLGLPRSKDIPPITEAQAEALDTVHFLAEKYALGLNFQKGDIQYINNLSIFHGRDGFTDTPDHTRHLLRLWLRHPELAWKIPAELEGTWKKLYYTATPDTEQFPAEPIIRNASLGGAKYA
ncbi:hypothetical protein B0H34DRAFT_791915 [Crassisporium funariophilum]|nr:hypothetical protein B0H34DRAFT_791915 [Crassisporium funariophilum]